MPCASDWITNYCVGYRKSRGRGNPYIHISIYRKNTCVAFYQTAEVYRFISKTNKTPTVRDEVLWSYAV